ncbi:Glutathionyl-hydroquinone reductase YqjG [Geodia barretti]|uniref:Glutathionyl-hydroquinone reductase YqjG n=1 Tax=Geodia barretti TaxID=519541 RepID=A0AA35TMZ0_GEOBA|nr:Glutathionyl-hydroquinone reductase YqjG [Geodia barretti]
MLQVFSGLVVDSIVFKGASITRRTFASQLKLVRTTPRKHTDARCALTALKKMQKEAKSDAAILQFAEKTGEFKRKPSSFRNWVTADGSSGFKAESGRYHLYVSYACPWAHRTLIGRKLKGLEDAISFDVVDYYMGEKGWRFNPDVPGATPDSVNGFSYMRELYFKMNPEYGGRFTVPVLYDKVQKTIVNNESSEILRMLNAEFNAFCKSPEQAAIDLYPEPLRAEVDALNEWIYPSINNGVYRAGFATKQEPYDVAVRELFAALDRVEAILAGKRYLAGDQLTEADVRLYTTLVRFDKVYVGHFKCNKKRVIDYPNIWGYMRDLYQTPGFGETTNFLHIEHHYQGSHTSINPHGIVAIGPDIDFTTPHDRDTRFSS